MRTFLFIFIFLRSLGGGGGTACPEAACKLGSLRPFFFFFFFIFLIFPFGLFFVSQRVGPSNAGTTSSLCAFQSSSSSDNVLFLFKEKEEEEEALPCSVSVCGYVLSFRIHWLIADKKKETKSRRVTV